MAGGASFRTVMDGTHGLYRITVSSGELPEPLTGRYTGRHLAEKALNMYIDALRRQYAAEKAQPKRGRNGTSKTKQAVQEPQ